jgi:hypothetical protein
LGDPTNLAAALSKTLGRHVEVDIRLAVEERFVSSETVEN